MRIYISTDIEGVAGVVNRDQTSPAGFEYEKAREFMTGELLAAIEGASEAGATSFVVSDSHGNGNNILIDRLPGNVEIIRSWPRPLMMMQGVEEPNIAGAMLVGHHAGASSQHGVMSHTMSSTAVLSLKLNGLDASETSINGRLAGYFGVPIIMVTGDDAYIPEARAYIKNVETVVTKWSYGTFSARSLTPAMAQEKIKNGARAAVKRINEFKPIRDESPITVELTLKSRMSIEWLGYLPFIERTGAHTVQFVASNILEVSKQLAFILGYGPNI
jgi:D-amino peptidase